MKKYLLLIATAIFTLNGFSQTVPDYVPIDGLVGYWPFNGNANDESGNANNGTVNGATLTTDKKGNTDSAYDFDGTDDNISVSHSADFDFTNTDDFSIHAWVKSDLLGSPGMIVSKIQNSGTYRGYEVYTNTLGEIGVYLINDFGAGNYILLQTDDTPLSDKKVHNVVVTYDGSSSASGIEIYVDGIIYPHTASTDNLSSTMQNIIPVNIGSRNEECCYESADIDDIGIWNRVLTDCEIQELYNSKLTATPDNSITQSGNTLTATQTGASYQWVDCDNVNAAISGATEQSYSPGVSGNFAVEVTVTDGACDVTETSECQSFSFVGVDENIQNKFSVYPNPTSDILSLELNKLSNSSYVITDQLGKVIKEGDVSSLKQDIDVSDLPNGVYVITVGEVNKKFIKE